MYRLCWSFPKLFVEKKETSKSAVNLRTSSSFLLTKLIYQVLYIVVLCLFGGDKADVTSRGTSTPEHHRRIKYALLPIRRLIFHR